jgi:uncharacterized RmlC-like cupin family protein
MKTIDIGPDGMTDHIVRFKDLQPKQGQYKDLGIPLDAYEMLTAKTLYSLLAPGDAAGSHKFAAASGPAGLSITIAECPPGDGPMLHAHMRTHEIFFCLTGKFEVSWGDDGQYSTVLDPHDMVDVPLGVTRAFKNVSDDTALLFVIILGGDQADVAYTHQIGEEVAERYGNDVKQAIETHTSMKFTAGLAD